MSKSNPEFTDELISAYLDGELSDEQRRIVEQAMEREPRYRQMFDELMALRNALHTLPQHQLDPAFHERVMERAFEAKAPAPTPAADPAHSRDPLWRRFVWSGVAIAAAILVMVLTQGWDSGLLITERSTFQHVGDQLEPTEMKPQSADSPVVDDEVAEPQAASNNLPNLRQQKASRAPFERAAVQPENASHSGSLRSFGSDDADPTQAKSLQTKAAHQDSRAPSGNTDGLTVDAVVYVSSPPRLQSNSVDYLLVEGSAAEIAKAVEQLERREGSSIKARGSGSSKKGQEGDSEALVTENLTEGEGFADEPLTDSVAVRLTAVDENSIQFRQLNAALNLEPPDLANSPTVGALMAETDDVEAEDSQAAILNDDENRAEVATEAIEDPTLLQIPRFRVAANDQEPENGDLLADDASDSEETGAPVQAESSLYLKNTDSAERPVSLMEQLRQLQEMHASGRELRILVVIPQANGQ